MTLSCRQSCSKRAARLGTLQTPFPLVKLCDFWHVYNVFIFFREFEQGLRCEESVCLGKGKCYRNGDLKQVSRNIIINKTLELNSNLFFILFFKFFFIFNPEDWHYVSKQLLRPWKQGVSSPISEWRGSTAKKTATPVKKKFSF